MELLLGFLPSAPAGSQSTICAYATLQDAADFAAATAWDATFNGDADSY